MINFDAITLNAFLKENIDFLQGARLQKIQQPTRRDFVLSFRNVKETRKLYININPNMFHICFMTLENEQKRRIEIPKVPPMFCMLLRKYLEGAKVSKVIQPQNEGDFGGNLGGNFERILEFYFETYNELSEKIYLCLAVELMGKHSNVVLYNFDTNVIIGCAHNVGEEKSRERQMAGGLPYAYPAKSTRNDYVVLYDYLKKEELGEGLSKSSVSETIDSYYANLANAEMTKNLRQKLKSNVSAKVKKVKNSLEKLKKQIVSTDKANSYRKKADLLMANLYSGKDFSKQIEVVDYETQEPLKIDLDETQSLKDNANRYYKLYNKAKTAAEKSNEYLENLKTEKDYLEQVLYSIDCALNLEDLIEIGTEINGENGKGKKEIKVNEKGKKEKEAPSLFTVKIPPFTVYVGKNNKQNDYIVSKLSRAEDIWFHAHNCAGSHVLLRVENGVEPDDKVIFECAKLAKEHSAAKNSSKVGVIYTKRKFLKKPPAAPLGYVIYKGEQEIIID